MRREVMLVGGFLVAVGAALMIIGLYWADSSTASSAGQYDRSGVYAGLGLLCVGIAVILFGLLMLYREFQLSIKGYDSEEVGGICPECGDPYRLGVNFCSECGEPLIIEEE